MYLYVLYLFYPHSLKLNDRVERTPPATIQKDVFDLRLTLETYKGIFIVIHGDRYHSSWPGVLP